VDRQVEAIRADDRLESDDIIYALNGVLRASERTVEIPPEVIAVEFTDGLLAELDRFSSMIWPHDVTDFHKNTMGHFYGVGIQIMKDPGEPLKVVTPLADSPALKAGIRPGDLITEVDGTETKGLSLDRLVSIIMGEKGTKVVLTVERRGRPTPLKVPIIRDKIDIKTVKGWKRQCGGKWQYLVSAEDGVGYIRLTQFTENSHQELLAALDDLRDELAEANLGQLQSLILDLRFNPGGLLRSATDIADEFVGGGRIVATRGRQKRPADIRAERTGRYLAGDLVVLVNEHSASAAEILSGALKDLERAGTKIIGKRTFGKGSVQNVIPIRGDRAYLKLTTAYYYLPSGDLIHRENGRDKWGVDPNIDVLITPKQAKRWLELRRQTDLLHQDEEPEWLDEDLREQYAQDLQLRTAVLLLKLMRLTDGQPAA
jgi:carboxyl-terminal processing protease